MRKVQVLLLAGLLFSSIAASQEARVAGHGFTDPSKIQWGPCPENLPPGCKVAVLQGDPSRPEPFTMRAWWPDGYKIMPHSHPVQENLTVISGKYHIGMGEEFVQANMYVIPTGGFSWMGAGMRHFTRAEGETIVQIHSIGPFTMTYVNAADDPRSR